MYKKNKLMFISYDRTAADIIISNYEGTGQQVVTTVPFSGFSMGLPVTVLLRESSL